MHPSINHRLYRLEKGDWIAYVKPISKGNVKTKEEIGQREQQRQCSDGDHGVAYLARDLNCSRWNYS